jgi:hypothetical protein
MPGQSNCKEPSRGIFFSVRSLVSPGSPARRAGRLESFVVCRSSSRLTFTGYRNEPQFTNNEYPQHGKPTRCR